MPNVSDFFSGSYLRAEDFKGKKVPVEIESVKVAQGHFAGADIRHINSALRRFGAGARVARVAVMPARGAGAVYLIPPPLGLPAKNRFGGRATRFHAGAGGQRPG